MTLRIFALLVLSALLACAAAPSELEFYSAPDPALRTLPFSEAVLVDDLLILSGQIGVAPGTLTLVPGGMAAEARQALENIRGVLARHGSSMGRVVKCTIFLADMRDWPAFNALYREYFTTPYPARSALGANGLALGAVVEVECIAAR